MSVLNKIKNVYSNIDTKFAEQFGFKMKDTSIVNVARYFHEPKDSSSLAVTRILFGLAMLFDIPDERGGATMMKRWGDPKMCHFPLLPFIKAIPMPYMALVYAAMWLGAVGIMLGYKYRITAPLYTACHWYLLLIEKSFWNNHSYLFGLVALLLSCTEANCYWSVDVYKNPTTKRSTVPYWNYFILKYQFFILYFMAGMKKGTAEWLTGYSVQNLSEHWVFTPFTLFLTVPQTDYLIVHWFIFVFDLTVAVWMMLARTRRVAMIFCALFHLMNSRLFTIGMFPWVCLATMPLFYSFDWPKQLLLKYKVISRILTETISRKIYKIVLSGSNQEINYNNTLNNSTTGTDNDNSEDYEDVSKKLTNEPNQESIKNELFDSNLNESNAEENEQANIQYARKQVKMSTENQKRTVYIILFYVFIQALLPYSHFITKGYNNWTDGLYGYSWDMMVHTWDVQSVVVKIIDNNGNKELYVDPYIYTPNDRWSRHGDMVYQYANCLKEKLLMEPKYRSNSLISDNISVYIDVWCSMNARFTQRMFDPNVDILKAQWTPFQRVPYLMPLLDEALDWRQRLDAIRKNVYSWNNYSDVVFFADFPGYYQEKYIPEELYNVTLTVLEGRIIFEPEVTNFFIGQSYQLTSKDYVLVKAGYFHKVINIGKTPAFYMYTFMNSTEINKTQALKPKLPIFKELHRRFNGMLTFCNLLFNNFMQILYKSPNKCI